jgi:hypothetical protein
MNLVKNAGNNLLNFIFGKLNCLNSGDQLKIIMKIVGLCVEHTIDLAVSTTIEKWYPIHLICSKDNNLNSSDQLRAIKVMIETKIDLNVCTDKKHRPIHFVCSEYNNLDSGDKLEAIKLFVTNDNVDLEVVDQGGFYPIYYICFKTNFNSSDQLKAIKLFVERKVNLEIPCGKNKEYPIHLICINDMNENDQLEAISILIDQKINLTVAALNGWTPLHLICYEKNMMCLKIRIQAIQLLVSNMLPKELEKNLEMTTNCGMCPIDVIKANLNISNEGKSKLIDALYSTLY